MKEGQPRFNRRTFLKGLAWFTTGIAAEAEAMTFASRSYQHRQDRQAIEQAQERVNANVPCQDEKSGSVTDNDEIAMNFMIGVALVGTLVGISRMWDSRKIRTIDYERKTTNRHKNES